MLPKNLKYGSKVESSVARSSRINIAPQNGTGNYSYGDTIILNIPTRNNLVLASTESYLKFKVAITNGTAANAFRWDSCGAHGLIQRIRVFHGSNLIQDIDQYGLLAKILFDLQMPTDGIYGKHTLLSGTRSDTVLASTTSLVVNQINSGERFGTISNAPFTLSAVATSLSDTYCLNLISLIGSLSSSNYLPLFAMTSAPLRVEIQLVSSLFNAISDLTDAGGQTSALALSNVEYIANIIELGDSAMSTIYGSLEGKPLQYVVPDFRNYQFTSVIPDNTSQQIMMPIPAKFSSLKNILVTSRDKGTGAAGGFFPFSSCVLGLSQYQFRIGAQIMPPKPPTTVAEFFAETLKAMGSIGDIHYTPSIDKQSYSLASSAASNDSTTVTSTVSSGSFCIGIDLENYSGADKSTIFSGLNTNTDDCYLQLDYGAVNRGAPLNLRLDAFSNFDSVLVCENQTAFIKF
jgi:hypothetical protein